MDFGMSRRLNRRRFIASAFLASQLTLDLAPLTWAQRREQALAIQDADHAQEVREYLDHARLYGDTGKRDGVYLVPASKDLDCPHACFDESGQIDGYIVAAVMPLTCDSEGSWLYRFESVKVAKLAPMPMDELAEIAAGIEAREQRQYKPYPRTLVEALDYAEDYEVETCL